MIKYKSTIGPKEKEAIAYLSLEKTSFSKRMKLISYLCTAVSLLSGFLAIKSLTHYGFNSSDLIMLLISLFLLYLGIDGVKRLNKLYFKKDISFSGDYDTTTSEYIITVDGISIIEDDNQTSYKWTVFKKWDEYEHYIYLRNKNDQIILIDKNKMNKDEIKELTTYLKVNIK